MSSLEEILWVLGVTRREAEQILSRLSGLAWSRAARRLVEKLPSGKRDRLNTDVRGMTPAKQIQIIAGVVREYFDQDIREQMHEQALHEVIEQEFLPAILQEATEAQRNEIQKIMVGE